jgi:hypothetical protein
MSLLFPSMVRDQVLTQHEQLRELIGGILAGEIGCERGDGPDAEAIERSARQLHGRFREHLAFEEQTLAPVLWLVDGWGPERVQDLRREHARQRQALDALIVGLESGWSTERTGRELRSLAQALLQDMKEEEEGCVRADLLCDGVMDRERRFL